MVVPHHRATALSDVPVQALLHDPLFAYAEGVSNTCWPFIMIPRLPVQSGRSIPAGHLGRLLGRPWG